MNKQEIQETINEMHRMKKRLTGAQGCSVSHQETNSYSAMCLSQAISVFGKEIPMKPEYECRKHLYICPHCGEYIDTYNQDHPYDYKCGGRLEWSR